MRIFFGGGDHPTQLKRLIDHNVGAVVISYFGWQQTHASGDLIRIIPHDVEIAITAGAARQKSLDWSEFALNYLDFCEANADRAALIFEMDSQHCPLDTRTSLRQALEPLPNIVMIPQRNEPAQLHATAARYERVGVNASLAKRCEPRDLRRAQATLYGSNVLSQSTLAAGRFEATTTMAWLSPRRYGELLLYTRTGKLRHFQSTERIKASENYKRDIAAYGIEPEACANGDMPSLTTLAIRSIEQMERMFNERRRDRRSREIADDSTEPVVQIPNAPDIVLPAVLPQIRSRAVLPVLTPPAQSNRSFAANPSSLRQCDTCSLADVCPKFEPHAQCSFDIPATIATKDDWLSACQVILDFQFQRVTFGHFSEQVEGGQITDRVGREMDRFMRLLGSVQQLQHTQEEAEGGILTQALRAITGQTEEAQTPNGDEDQEGSSGRDTEVDIDLGDKDGDGDEDGGSV